MSETVWIDTNEESGWRMGDYDNGDNGCKNCGRHRVCLCENGRHRCEKCNWCHEINDYAPVDLHYG